MINLILIIALAFIALVLVFGVGFLVGLGLKQTREIIATLRSDFDTYVEEEASDESAVVETSPQLIRERIKTRGTDELDDDSAIITIKTPQEVKRERDEKEQAELDRLTR